MRNIKTILRYGLLFSAAILGCTACSEDEGIGKGMNEESGYLRVMATIGDAVLVQTKGDENEGTPTNSLKDRAGVPLDQLYSYSSSNDGNAFTSQSKIGMFSYRSIKGDEDDNNLKNLHLTHVGVGNYFQADIVIPSISNLGCTFAYYPYSTNNNVDNENLSTNKKKKYPIDIYAVGTEDNSEIYYAEGNNNKVVDLLVASNNGSIGSEGMFMYNLRHACAMLVLYIGDGFDVDDDKITEEEVVVKLKEKINVYAVSEGANWSLETEGNGTTTGDEVMLPMNKCDSYTLPGITKPSLVYSVILPPSAEIDYIKIKDKFGDWQYVKPKEGQTLFGKLEGGNKYPVTVELDGLEPTIYPHDITEWTDESITIEKVAGIYNADDLQTWSEEMVKESPSEETLKKFGKKSDDGKWTFYINDNIDCSNLPTADAPIQSLLSTFDATLDGRGRTLSNLTLKKTADGGANIGLFGTLKGTVTNLKIDNITIEGATGEGASEETCIGTIAGVIEGGEVRSCKVTGISITSDAGHVGALAGKAKPGTSQPDSETRTGTVEKCTFEGRLFLGSGVTINSPETVRNLFGSMENGFGLTDFTTFNTEKIFILQSNKEPDKEN